MTTASRRRVVIWTLALGCASALVAAKGATTFGASDLKNIAAFLAGGCVLGCLLGLLTTAYNEKRRTLFHIWGWALLLMLIGLAFNTGTSLGYVFGALIGAVCGTIIGSLLYFRVFQGTPSPASKLRAIRRQIVALCRIGSATLANFLHS